MVESICATQQGATKDSSIQSRLTVRLSSAQPHHAVELPIQSAAAEGRDSLCESAALALSNNAIDDASSSRLVARAKSSNCCRLVALAMGAVMLGRAMSQARATCVGVAWWRFANWSRASRMRSPRRFRYFLTICPRWLFERSASERYLPLRNPLASAK